MIRHLFTAMLGETWAMRHDYLAGMWAAACGDAEISTDIRVPRKLPRVSGAVVILPLQGVISQRQSVWQGLFGGTATESFGAAFSSAINHPKVGAILIDTDSPGGTISGVPELADMIHYGGTIKPVAAIANSEMASAAYWLASQVGGNQKRLVASPSAEAGSIGVYRVHEDYSELLAAEGIRVSFLAVPETKVEANPYEPLSDAAREHHMEQVQAAYDQFVVAVSRGRGVNKSAVRDGFGKGRMFHAQQAAEMGLVDRVATREQLLSELGGATSLGAKEAAIVQDELTHAWEIGLPQKLINPEYNRRHELMQQRLRGVIPDSRPQCPLARQPDQDRVVN